MTLPNIIYTYMITTYQLFCETISLSQAKKYTKLWYESGGNNIHAEFFSKLFKGKPDTKYRLYYPFQMDGVEEKIVDSLETEITTLLTDNGYADVDYIRNKVTDKYKRTVKISSVLSKLKQQKLLDKYNANLNRSNVKTSDDYMVVISRHPVDLAGMSTNRGWTSCMDLKDGANTRYIKEDVVYGTLSAYIIKSSDTNIQKPIARCLIKPFTNLDNYTIYLPEKSIYGTLSETTQKKFLTFINSWCEDNFNKDSTDDRYYKNHKLYADDGYNKVERITSLRKYLIDNFQYDEETNTVYVYVNLDLTNTNLKSLDTEGLKVIVDKNLVIKDNPNLTSFKGIENWDVKGDIKAEWKNIKDINLKHIILYSHKSYIKWIDDNTISINDNLHLTDIGLTSLDTDGLKIRINGFLYLKYNPELTSLDGLENFEVEGNIYASWKHIKGITLKDIILYEYRKDSEWINENTIKIKYHLYLRNFGLTSLDTNGLKVIVNHNLDITSNPELKSLTGIENFRVNGEVLADWNYFKDITLRQIILYKYSSNIDRFNDNTVIFIGDLNLSYKHLKSLDTGGLNVKVTGDLDITNNPELTSFDGLKNFEVRGTIHKD